MFTNIGIDRFIPSYTHMAVHELHGYALYVTCCQLFESSPGLRREDVGLRERASLQGGDGRGRVRCDKNIGTLQLLTQCE